jgi:hypothetical protein
MCRYFETAPNILKSNELSRKSDDGIIEAALQNANRHDEFSPMIPSKAMQ